MMLQKTFCTFLVLLALVLTKNSAKSARILGLFVAPSKSHHILSSKLLVTLAGRGHDVTMVSPYQLKQPIPNYREVVLEEMHQFKQDKMQDIMSHNLTLWKQFNLASDKFIAMSEILLSNKKLEILKKENFDLIIQLGIFTECQLGLAHHFNAPVILMSTTGAVPTMHRIFGTPAPPSYVPNLGLVLSDTGELSFLKRVLNALSSFAFYGFLAQHYDNKQQELLSKYFPEAPSLDELKENYVALAFINSHYSLEDPRPSVPNMISIGGFHVEPPRKLPDDLQKYLDGAKQGAIYFSLGSNVKIENLPKDKVDAILNVLKATNMSVLFKTEHELENIPKNVKTAKWLPQNDILAHPNVKLFISHGGLLSTIEAVYFGVPILGLPIFGDQATNIANAVNDGYAVKVEINDLTEEVFSNAVQEILTNPKYKENVKLRSSLMTDQEIKPLDRAIYWVEHVLKYKGAEHLKNNGANLYLYQYLLLDVIAFIFITVFLVLWIICKMIKKILSFFANLLNLNKPKRD